MSFKERPKPPSKFLKIQDGESIQGVIRGDAVGFFRRGKLPNVEISDEYVEGSRFRFLVNVIVIVPGKPLDVKVWEQGGQVYDRLFALQKKIPLSRSIVKITRIGDGLSTSYLIEPTQIAMTPKQLGAIENAKLHELNPHKDKPAADAHAVDDFDGYASFDESNDPAPF